MKRKLLLAALCVVGALGFNANAQQTPTADGIYYVYNPLTGKFMSRGSSWGTRAIVDDYGLPIKLEATGDNFYLKCTDNELYMSDDGWMYTDGGKDGDNPRARIVTISSVDGLNATYVLTNTSNNLPVYVYLTDDGSKYCMAGNGTKNDNYTDDGQTQWQFMTQEEHDAIVAAKQLANHIAIAASAGGTVTTEAEFTSFLSEGYETLNVTTTYLGTDNLNSNGAGNWTVNGVNKLNQDWATYVGGGNGVAESFSAATSLTKSLTGLTEGIYKVSMNGFFRQGNNGVCWSNKNAGFLPSNAYLQAGDYAVALKAWGTEATFDGNETYTPDNTTQANSAFNNGDYINELYTYVGADGNLTLTVGIPSFISWAGWACYNNVQLTYYRDKSADVVPVTAINLNPSSSSLTTGGVLTLTATVTPDNADDRSVTWTSSDETVATVAEGVVTALKAGTTTITASANGGENVSATCTVTVADAAAPSFYSSEIVDGEDYYIMNAATGKFLGGANDWGTHASIIEHGIPFTVALSNGKYTLDSHTYNSANEHFFNGTYVDGATTNLYITALNGGKYSISTADGSAYVSAKSGTTVVDNTAANAESSHAQWYFLSKKDRDKMLAVATNENPADATYYIKQANPSRNLSAGAHNENAWSQYSVGGTQNNSNFVAQVYNATVDNYQTIENIPNGTYTVTVQAFTSGTDVKFYANNAKVDVKANDSGATNCSAASNFFAQGLYPNTVTVTVTDRTLKIGFEGDCTGKWLCYDNVEMYMTSYTANMGIIASIDNDEIEVGQTAQITAATDPATASFNALTFTSSDDEVATVDEDGVVTAVAVGEATITITANEMETFSETIDVTVTYTSATAQDYADLNAAIEAAEAKVIGFEDGEYAAYNNADALAALAAAKAIDQTVSNTQISVQTATANLTSAVWTVNEGAVNALANADFEGTYAPKANSGVSSDRAIYQPNGWEVDVTGGIDSNDMTILNSECLAANNFTSITALSTGGNNTYLYRGKWGNNTNIDIYQNVTLPAGTYSLTCDAWKSGLGGDGNIFVDSQTASLSGNETSWRTLNIQFTLSEEKTVKVGFHLKHNNDGSEKFLGFDNFELYKLDEATMTVKAGKYGTFVAPFQVEIPTGIVAYEVASVTDKDVKLVEINGSILAAQTPVILKNTTETDKTETFYGTSLTDADTKDSNYLVGVYKAGVDIPEGSYVLQTDTETNEQAFYVVGSGFTSTPNRCYLKASAGANVRSISFAGEATGIEAIGVLTSGNYDAIYTAGGAKVNSLQKGLNIVVKDGKSYKIFVK